MVVFLYLSRKKNLHTLQANIDKLIANKDILNTYLYINAFKSQKSPTGITAPTVVPDWGANYFQLYL